MSKRRTIVKITSLPKRLSKIIKRLFFRANQKAASNWRQGEGLYNEQGKKTANVFNSTTSEKNTVKMQAPVSGKPIISSDYGKDRGSYIHQGIDFDGQMGDKISSAANGKVIFAGHTKGGRNEVVIQHANNVVTKYAHLENINVKEGQFVKAGDEIGTMGNTGNSHTADEDNGSHLHFEVLENGENVDPDKYLNLRKAEHEKGDYGSPNICGTIDSCGSSSCGSEESSDDGSSGSAVVCGGEEDPKTQKEIDKLWREWQRKYGSSGSSGPSGSSGSGERDNNYYVSENGLNFIKNYEGNLHQTVYRDSAGKKTIGYGHLVKEGESFDEPISKEKAEELLREDLQTARNFVEENVTRDLNQHQKDALVSLAFNVGTGSVENGGLKGSDTIEELNEGDWDALREEWKEWRLAGGEPKDGLENRRKDELEMFFCGDYDRDHY